MTAVTFRHRPAELKGFMDQPVSKDNRTRHGCVALIDPGFRNGFRRSPREGSAKLREFAHQCIEIANDLVDDIRKPCRGFLMIDDVIGLVR